MRFAYLKLFHQIYNSLIKKSKSIPTAAYVNAAALEKIFYLEKKNEFINCTIQKRLAVVN